MIMRKKIRVKIPLLVYEIITEDLKYFKLKRETLYNIILKELGFEKLSDVGKELLELDRKQQIAFNLNEMNTSLIFGMLATHKLETDTAMILKVFSFYANLHPAVRERLICKDLFLRLEKAIQEKKEIKIFYEDKIQKIIPISFERDTETGYNYLKGKMGKDEFLYRVKEIKFVS